MKGKLEEIERREMMLAECLIARDHQVKSLKMNVCFFEKEVLLFFSFVLFLFPFYLLLHCLS